jgi:hypothetical protein
MHPGALHRSLISLLRGSTRVAALVLALFLANIAGNVACADHDLADAGIGQHQSHMPAPDGTPSTSTPADSTGHCSHTGGVHAPTVLSTAAAIPLDPSAALNFSDEPFRASALGQRELRPPIR